MEISTDGFCREYRETGMKKKKWIMLLSILLILFMWSTTVMASEDKGTESIAGWMIEKIAGGEVEIGDEDSIREAIEEGEKELSVTLTEEEKDKIVDFVKSLDTIEVGAGDFMEEAKDMYRKYSTELVEQANDAINEAVESAVEGAVNNFFQSLKQTVSDFFTNLLSI